VLIASAERLPTFTSQRGDSGELLAFTDADALRALDAITSRRPALVVLDRTFASTPRGAALINRIKGDPSLKQTEIRVVSPEGESPRVPPRRPSDGSRDVAAGVAAAPPASPQLPQHRGTRRAPRFKMAGSIDARVDGHWAALVDVSTIGAQIISTVALKPNQRVRVVLSDTQGAVRCTAVVTWASLESRPQSGPRYRAGLEFLDANTAALDAYCSRHKAL
jgi:hypothetical protein